jgi:hypothetical protein
MSIPQYLRQISLKIGNDTEAIDLSELRIRFSVRRGTISTPNTADIRVYNVSAATARKAQLKEFGRVVLMAGYAGNYGVIFDGTIKQVRRGRESQTDTYLDITAADGDSAYNWSVINMSLAAGSTAQDHLKSAVQAMEGRGVTMGDSGTLSTNKLPRGKVMFGLTRDVLDNLGRTQDVSWSIQDGKMTLIPNTAYLPGDAIVVNYQTGMVGLPEQTQNGVNVRILLNPSVKIGRLLKIDNESIQRLRLSPAPLDEAQNRLLLEQISLAADGVYKTLIADHHGDTRGNEWYTDVICVSVDATVFNTLLRNSATPGAIAEPGAVKPYG